MASENSVEEIITQFIRDVREKIKSSETIKAAVQEILKDEPEHDSFSLFAEITELENDDDTQKAQSDESSIYEEISHTPEQSFAKIKELAQQTAGRTAVDFIIFEQDKDVIESIADKAGISNVEDILGAFDDLHKAAKEEQKKQPNIEIEDIRSQPRSRSSSTFSTSEIGKTPIKRSISEPTLTQNPEGSYYSNTTPSIASRDFRRPTSPNLSTADSAYRYSRAAQKDNLDTSSDTYSSSSTLKAEEDRYLRPNPSVAEVPSNPASFTPAESALPSDAPKVGETDHEPSVLTPEDEHSLSQRNYGTNPNFYNITGMTPLLPDRGPPIFPAPPPPSQDNPYYSKSASEEPASDTSSITSDDDLKDDKPPQSPSYRPGARPFSLEPQIIRPVKGPLSPPADNYANLPAAASSTSARQDPMPDQRGEPQTTEPAISPTTPPADNYANLPAAASSTSARQDPMPDQRGEPQTTEPAISPTTPPADNYANLPAAASSTSASPPSPSTRRGPMSDQGGDDLDILFDNSNPQSRKSIQKDVLYHKVKRKAYQDLSDTFKDTLSGSTYIRPREEGDAISVRLGPGVMGEDTIRNVHRAYTGNHLENKIQELADIVSQGKHFDASKLSEEKQIKLQKLQQDMQQYHRNTLADQEFDPASLTLNYNESGVPLVRNKMRKQAGYPQDIEDPMRKFIHEEMKEHIKQISPDNLGLKSKAEADYLIGGLVNLQAKGGQFSIKRGSDGNPNIQIKVPCNKLPGGSYDAIAQQENHRDFIGRIRELNAEGKGDEVRRLLKETDEGRALASDLTKLCQKEISENVSGLFANQGLKAVAADDYYAQTCHTLFRKIDIEKAVAHLIEHENNKTPRIDISIEPLEDGPSNKPEPTIVVGIEGIEDEVSLNRNPRSMGAEAGMGSQMSRGRSVGDTISPQQPTPGASRGAGEDTQVPVTEFGPPSSTIKRSTSSTSISDSSDSSVYDTADDERKSYTSVKGIRDPGSDSESLASFKSTREPEELGAPSAFTETGRDKVSEPESLVSPSPDSDANLYENINTLPDRRPLSDIPKPPENLSQMDDNLDVDLREIEDKIDNLYNTLSELRGKNTELATKYLEKPAFEDMHRDIVNADRLLEDIQHAHQELTTNLSLADDISLTEAKDTIEDNLEKIFGEGKNFDNSQLDKLKEQVVGVMQEIIEDQNRPDLPIEGIKPLTATLSALKESCKGLITGLDDGIEIVSSNTPSMKEMEGEELSRMKHSQDITRLKENNITGELQTNLLGKLASVSAEVIEFTETKSQLLAVQEDIDELTKKIQEPLKHLPEGQNRSLFEAFEETMKDMKDTADTEIEYLEKDILEKRKNKYMNAVKSAYILREVEKREAEERSDLLEKDDDFSSSIEDDIESMKSIDSIGSSVNDEEKLTGVQLSDPDISLNKGASIDDMLLTDNPEIPGPLGSILTPTPSAEQSKTVSPSATDPTPGTQIPERTPSSRGEGPDPSGSRDNLESSASRVTQRETGDIASISAEEKKLISETESLSKKVSSVAVKGDAFELMVFLDKAKAISEKSTDINIDNKKTGKVVQDLSEHQGELADKSVEFGNRLSNATKEQLESYKEKVQDLSKYLQSEDVKEHIKELNTDPEIRQKLKDKNNGKPVNLEQRSELLQTKISKLSTEIEAKIETAVSEKDMETEAVDPKISEVVQVEKNKGITSLGKTSGSPPDAALHNTRAQNLASQKDRESGREGGR